MAAAREVVRVVAGAAAAVEDLPAVPEGARGPGLADGGLRPAAQVPRHRVARVVEVREIILGEHLRRRRRRGVGVGAAHKVVGPGDPLAAAAVVVRRAAGHVGVLALAEADPLVPLRLGR